MRGAILRVVLVALAAAVLHLPAHFAPWSDSPRREPLPEDAPAFTNNAALADGTKGVLGAAFDRAAAWDRGADSVGAVRWRPAATALHVLERGEDPARSVAFAGAVSLLLHVLTAIGAMRLAAALGASERASVVAGLLTAACPAALAAAAWPARQAAVLAACLAVHGAVLAVRGTRGRMFLGGALLALAGLAHEMAFAWTAAAALLVSLRAPRTPRGLAAWPCVVLPAAAFAWRCAFLGGLGAAPGERPANAPNAIDGLTGVVRAVGAFLVPVSARIADGPFTYPFLAHLGAVAALAAGVAWLWRRRAEPDAAALLASLAVLAAIPLGYLAGAGIAPYQDAYLYMALPLLAASTAHLFARAEAAGGPFRGAVTGVVALLLAATAAVTATRAPSFRTRAAFLDFARSEAPESLVVGTWDAASRVRNDPQSLAAAAPGVRALASSVLGDEGKRLARDAVASSIVANFLSEYAGALTASPLPVSDAAYDAGDDAASAAAVLRPASARVWWELARFRWKTGSVRGARSAVERAIALAPRDIAVVQIAAQTAMLLGDSRFAADLLEEAHGWMRADPAVKSIPVEFLLLYAKALAADGALRVPDPSSDRGLRYRFDIAADILESVTQDIPEQAKPTSDGKKLLYDVYLRYGDLLASTDRTVMALNAYRRAIDLTGGKGDSNAALHRKWLVDRLAADLKSADEAVKAASLEPGQPNVGNATLALYVALCRFGDERLSDGGTIAQDADRAFASLEAALGGVTPELRFTRAVERYAARDDEPNQSKAEAELLQVLAEKPSITKARFELAKVLEWQGTIERLSKARDEYERAANEGAFEDWSLDAIERAEVLDKILAPAAVGGGG